MTWLTVTECLCHRSSRVCSVCHSYNSVIIICFLIYHRRVPLVEQELLTFPDDLILCLFVMVFMFLNLFLCSALSLLAVFCFCFLSISHCMACPS